MVDLKIAIDCMGGDFGPSVVIAAVHQSLLKHQKNSSQIKYASDRSLNSNIDTCSAPIPNVHFKLFGNEVEILSELSKSKILNHPNISIIQSEDDVLMTDKPLIALKKKKRSSMRLALESVRDGRSHACVSAGNTGALMAVARFILKMLPGIERPAIISAIPTLKDSSVYLLDLGANIDCDEKRLFQFAVMGNVLCKSIDGITNPKIGLLNVGEEEMKGSERLKNTAKLLEEHQGLNYCGFVEANQIFTGDYDVIVTDGFTGNSVLKASEGLSEFLTTKLRLAFQRNWWTKWIAIFAKPVINIFKHEINPERYNGACFIGLRGVVVKSHGGANVNATFFAIEEAISQAIKKVPSRIRETLESN